MVCHCQAVPKIYIVFLYIQHRTFSLGIIKTLQNFANIIIILISTEQLNVLQNYALQCNFSANRHKWGVDRVQACLDAWKSPNHLFAPIACDCNSFGHVFLSRAHTHSQAQPLFFPVPSIIFAFIFRPVMLNCCCCCCCCDAHSAIVFLPILLNHCTCII